MLGRNSSPIATHCHRGEASVGASAQQAGAATPAAASDVAPGTTVGTAGPFGADAWTRPSLGSAMRHRLEAASVESPVGTGPASCGTAASELGPSSSSCRRSSPRTANPVGVVDLTDDTDDLSLVSGAHAQLHHSGRPRSRRSLDPAEPASSPPLTPSRKRRDSDATPSRPTHSFASATLTPHPEVMLRTKLRRTSDRNDLTSAIPVFTPSPPAVRHVRPSHRSDSASYSGSKTQPPADDRSHHHAHNHDHGHESDPDPDPDPDSDSGSSVEFVKCDPAPKQVAPPSLPPSDAFSGSSAASNRGMSGQQFRAVAVQGSPLPSQRKKVCTSPPPSRGASHSEASKPQPLSGLPSSGGDSGCSSEFDLRNCESSENRARAGSGNLVQQQSLPGRNLPGRWRLASAPGAERRPSSRIPGLSQRQRHPSKPSQRLAGVFGSRLHPSSAGKTTSAAPRPSVDGGATAVQGAVPVRPPHGLAGNMSNEAGWPTKWPISTPCEIFQRPCSRPTPGLRPASVQRPFDDASRRCGEWYVPTESEIKSEQARLLEEARLEMEEEDRKLRAAAAAAEGLPAPSRVLPDGPISSATALSTVLTGVQPLEVLGLPSGSTTRTIQSRFRALALALHPDKNQDARAPAAFQKLKEARQAALLACVPSGSG